MSEGSDLGVRHASEQSQQGGEEVFVINEVVATGVHQNPGKLTEAGFETLRLKTSSA